MKLTKQQFIDKVLPNLPDSAEIFFDKISDQNSLLDGNGNSIFKVDRIINKYVIQFPEPTPKSEHEKKVFGE